MKTNFLRLVLGYTLTMTLGISIAVGQTVTGSITGVVTDPSGAFISGAHVVAHNIDTSVDTGTNTNSTGLYRIEFLPIGHYQVTVQAKGFNTDAPPAFCFRGSANRELQCQADRGKFFNDRERLGSVADPKHQRPHPGQYLYCEYHRKFPFERPRLFFHHLVCAGRNRYRGYFRYTEL